MVVGSDACRLRQANSKRLEFRLKRDLEKVERRPVGDAELPREPVAKELVPA